MGETEAWPVRFLCFASILAMSVLSGDPLRQGSGCSLKKNFLGKQIAGVKGALIWMSGGGAETIEEKGAI